MDYIKLDTRFYRDPAILEANRRTRGKAETLFLRALAQVGADESEGVLLHDSVKFLNVSRAEKVAEVLVEVGLWETTDTGWRVRSWDKWQSEHDALARRRRADRERKRVERAKAAAAQDSPPDPPPVQRTSRDVSRDRPPPNARDYRDREIEDVEHPTDLALVDAREHDRGRAGAITALYAAGVPLSDHGRAHRTIAAALDAGYTDDLIRRGVGRLIAEQRTCTLETLRIAMHTDDTPPGPTGRRRTATEKANAWLTVGTDDHPTPLRALPGGTA